MESFEAKAVEIWQRLKKKFPNLPEKATLEELDTVDWNDLSEDAYMIHEYLSALKHYDQD